MLVFFIQLPLVASSSQLENHSQPEDNRYELTYPEIQSQVLFSCLKLYLTNQMIQNVTAPAGEIPI